MFDFDLSDVGVKLTPGLNASKVGLQGLGIFADVDTVWHREFPSHGTDSIRAMTTASENSEELIYATEKFRP